jgi:hypothetical protein
MMAPWEFDILGGNLSPIKYIKISKKLMICYNTFKTIVHINVLLFQ